MFYFVNLFCLCLWLLPALCVCFSLCHLFIRSVFSVVIFLLLTSAIISAHFTSCYCVPTCLIICLLFPPVSCQSPPPCILRCLPIVFVLCQASLPVSCACFGFILDFACFLYPCFGIYFGLCTLDNCLHQFRLCLPCFGL